MTRLFYGLICFFVTACLNDWIDTLIRHIDWWIDWLIDLLIDWLIDWLTDRNPFDRSFDEFECSLIEFLALPGQQMQIKQEIFQNAKLFIFKLHSNVFAQGGALGGVRKTISHETPPEFAIKDKFLSESNKQGQPLGQPKGQPLGNNFPSYPPTAEVKGIRSGRNHHFNPSAEYI